MNNDKFWKLVDRFENGEIDRKELFNILLKENKGDIDETWADYDLATFNQDMSNEDNR